MPDGSAATVGDALAEAVPRLKVEVAWSGLLREDAVAVGVEAKTRLVCVKKEYCELMVCV